MRSGERVQLAPLPEGVGARDVAYPGPMIGEWKVTRVLVDVEFPGGMAGVDEAQARGLLASKRKQHDVFAMRFIRNEQLVPKGVVEDRAFNTAALLKVTHAHTYTHARTHTDIDTGKHNHTNKRPRPSSG